MVYNYVAISIESLSEVNIYSGNREHHFREAVAMDVHSMYGCPQLWTNFVHSYVAIFSERL